MLFRPGHRSLVFTWPFMSFHLCLNFPSLFVFLLIWTQPKYYSATPRLSATSLPKPNQSKISPSIVFGPQSQTPISALAHVRETVHVAKCLNPPLLRFCCRGLAIPPRSPSAIYIWLSKFFHSLYCVTSLEQQTVENVSVLRKGEYHNKGVQPQSNLPKRVNVCHKKSITNNVDDRFIFSCYHNSSE